MRDSAPNSVGGEKCGLDQPRLLDRRLDEGGEERMRLKRAGGELGVELDAHEPGMIGALHDFRQLTIGRKARDPHASVVEPPAVADVHLVAMAVALENPLLAIDRAHPASLL